MDLLGKALLDFYTEQSKGPLRSHSSLGGVEEVPVSYFFRPFPTMPDIEQEALLQCRGSVLDIGCGAGSHCLYLQESGLDCTGLDNSPEGIQVATERGVLNTVCADILNFQSGKFDTLLVVDEWDWNCGFSGSVSQIFKALKGFVATRRPNPDGFQ